jgi:beta-lactamase regulating signal transducer with metallopeptidase domain
MNSTLPMTFAAELLPGSFVWTIAWQSTVILSLGLVLARLLQRQAAKAHLALVLATIAAVVSPVLTMTVRHLDWGVLAARPLAEIDQANLAAITPVSATSERANVPPTHHAARPAEMMTNLANSSALEPPFDSRTEHRVSLADEPPHTPQIWMSRLPELLPTSLAVCWIVASSALALRLGVSLLQAARTAREAGEETDAELRAALGAAADALALRTVPQLRVSPSIRCPMIWCWGSRPALLLPDSAAASPSVNWRSVFCHELAHFVRRDHCSAMWAELLVIALPWQPLSWHARKQLAVSREQACDDWALAAGGEAIDYAESLLQLVPQRAPDYALAAVSSRHSLKRRLEHVLAGVRIAPKVGRRWIVATSLVSLAAAAGIAFAQQRTAPATDRNAQKSGAATESKAPAGQNKLIPAKEERGEVFTVRGRVLRPDGQPAGGARVSIVRYYFDLGSKRLSVATGQAGPRGEFELSYRKSQFLEGVARPEQWKETTVVAEADRFGLEWVAWGDIEPSKPLELRLVPDIPIHGRVLDLQGRPVAGVRVHLGGVEASHRGRLDDWLAAVKKGATPWVASPLLARNLPPVDARDEARATTEGDGRFTLNRIGAEHVATLELRGETIAYTSLTVVTRTMPPLTQEVLDSATQRAHIFGNDFTVEAAMTQPILGTVRDAATKEPLAGVAIESWHFAGEKISGIRVLRTESDARGHYRLVGMPKGPGNKIMVLPNDDQPYFMRERDVPSQAGSGPVTLDIDLHRGLWITGRVTDQVTRQPVLATLHYYPFRTNAYVSRIPEFDRSGNVDGIEFRYYTRPDGSFRIPGMPGRAIVGAQAILATYRQGVGADAISGKNKNGFFETYSNPIYPGAKWPNALVEINPAATDRAVACALTVDPGESVQVRLVDPAGLPIAGCEIQGRSFSGWDSNSPATIDVVNLTPGEVRPLVIRHEKRGLGKFLALKFDKKTPHSLTVRLEPSATIAGRLVDKDGVTLKGVTLQAVPSPSGDFWPRLSPIVCQTDGTFQYKVPTGCPYSLSATGQSFGFASAADKVSVKPGATTELGDIKLDGSR